MDRSRRRAIPRKDAGEGLPLVPMVSGADNLDRIRSNCTQVPVLRRCFLVSCRPRFCRPESSRRHLSSLRGAVWANTFMTVRPAISFGFTLALVGGMCAALQSVGPAGFAVVLWFGWSQCIRILSLPRRGRGDLAAHVLGAALLAVVTFVFAATLFSECLDPTIPQSTG